MMVRFVLISGGNDDGLGEHLEKHLSGINKSMSTTPEGKIVIEVCETQVDRAKTGVKRAMLEAMLAGDTAGADRVKSAPAPLRREGGSKEYVFQMAQNW